MYDQVDAAAESNLTLVFVGIMHSVFKQSIIVFFNLKIGGLGVSMLKSKTMNEIVEIHFFFYLIKDCISLVHTLVHLVHTGQIQMMKYSVSNENTYIIHVI